MSPSAAAKKKPQKKITLQDLAKLASVSPATVSRVISGRQTVDPAIRAKVRQAAKRLGVDLDERWKEKSRIIAFLLANRNVLHSFQAHVLLGAERHLANSKWEMLFMSFHYEPTLPPPALHLPQLLNPSTNARAAVLGGSNSANLITALFEREIPFSVLGNNVFGEWDASKHDVVYSDDISGAKEATLHLLQRGHKNIAFIGNLAMPWFLRCSQGYRAAMDEAKAKPRIIDLGFDGKELGILGTKTLLSNRHGVTAILAGSDQVASGVYEALRDASISIPDEISVVGFNDTEATLLHPQLTSVREFPEELGRNLAQFVLNRLQNPDLPPQQMTVPTRLIPRESVRSL